MLPLPGCASADVAAAVVAVVAARRHLPDGPLPRLALKHVAASPHPRLLSELADARFDRARDPALRAVVFDGALLLVASSHALDLDSLGHLMSDISVVLAGGSPPAAPPPARVIDLTRVPTVVAGAARDGRRTLSPLSPATLAAVDALADSLGRVRADVFLAAYALLLHALGETAPVIGVVTRHADAGSALGALSPVLPVAIEMSSPLSLRELVVAVGDARGRSEQSPGHASLSALFEDGDDGLPGAPVHAGRRSARADIGLVVLPAAIGWEHGDRFTAAEADGTMASYAEILARALGSPHLPVTVPTTAAGTVSAQPPAVLVLHERPSSTNGPRDQQ